MIALAACSTDCDTMWQIGVDVLEGYRNQGIGASITNMLAHEILDRGGSSVLLLRLVKSKIA